MVTPTALEAELLAVAGSVLDPELPVLTLRELGVLRAVHVRDADTVEVDLTPTYTGCPAVEAMSLDIERALHEHGVREVTVRTVLLPAWSTDDISAEGRRKLREFGIAPPRARGADGPVGVSLGPTRTLGTTPTAAGASDPEPVRCPHCGSADTELLSRFSSTACKALRRCLACREPFDHFKEL
ncbi:1,2-phenylacetyl-CoA epoxidase subunit PaaD [Streptomyces asoensis]|uniref:Phenylacetic acid degradation protein n=1 Tax=Streptomyces asoensis TaxID=249586 RepID=A0ABQ3S218_9ACTN|nr:1,2-phenylacetyl-CoA epoxidase subunit PaaD [Streptomyces asoensis]GGQ74029.1 phenylacetic acid degradation protein [Streptomyces asoensis]GHI62169.1 phenylacetic acid degradation protein [Streptomyces asoensis]